MSSIAALTFLLLQFEANDENRVRHAIMEILSRLTSGPHTELLKPNIMDILQVAMKVLQDDNEDNALIAQRVIFELHKAHRPYMESQVQVCDVHIFHI